MSWDEEKRSRSMLDRLRELDLALANRIVAEQTNLWYKQMELQSIEQQLRRYAPIIGLGLVGAAVTGELEKAKQTFLLSRRAELIREIQREKQELDRLRRQRSEVAEGIVRLTAELARIRTEMLGRVPEEVTARQARIQQLIDMYTDALYRGDMATANRIREMLRRMGVSI